METVAMSPDGLIERVTDEEAWSQPSSSSFRPQKYAELITSDDDYLIFRRFGALSARIILDLQNDLATAERELQVLDEKCSVPGNLAHESPEKNDHVLLLLEIKEKLKEYS